MPAITLAVASGVHNHHDLAIAGIPWGSPLERFLERQLGYIVPNSEHNPRVKAGHWDGFTSLLTRFNETFHRLPSGLVHRFLTAVDAFNGPNPDADHRVWVDVQNRWKRTESTVLLTHPQKHMLRDYQRHAVDVITSAPVLMCNSLAEPRLFNRGHGVLQAGTGAGKTLMATYIAYERRKPVVFFVNSIDLMDQTIATFKEEFPWQPIGCFGDGMCDIQDVTVALFQSVHAWTKRLTKTEYDSKLDRTSTSKAVAGKEVEQTEENKAKFLAWLSRPCILILDECHTIAAPSTYDVARSFAMAEEVYALSASPWRDDGLDLLIEAVCGPVRVAISASQLIAAGWLVPPMITMHTAPAPTDNLRALGLDAVGPRGGMSHVDLPYPQLYEVYISNNEPRNALIEGLWNEAITAGRVPLVLVKRIEHGKNLEQRLEGSVFIDGSYSRKRRKALWQKLREGEVKGVIATSLADQGIDVPNLDALILAGGGKSSTRALQRIGRVLRLSPGKTYATVAEFHDQHIIFKRHLDARLRMYQREPAFTVQFNNQAAPAAQP